MSDLLKSNRGQAEVGQKAHYLDRNSVVNASVWAHTWCGYSGRYTIVSPNDEAPICKGCERVRRQREGVSSPRVGPNE